MGATSGGRSCAKCQHTVPDLTQASDDEIIELLSRKDAPHCARFRSDQVDRTTHAKTPDPVLALQLLALAAATPLAVEAEDRTSDKGPTVSVNSPISPTVVTFVMGDVWVGPDEGTIFKYAQIQECLPIYGLIVGVEQVKEVVPQQPAKPVFHAVPVPAIPERDQQEDRNGIPPSMNPLVAVLERKLGVVRSIADAARSVFGWLR
jgi:hypothetical protein